MFIIMAIKKGKETIAHFKEKRAWIQPISVPTVSFKAVYVLEYTSKYMDYRLFRTEEAARKAFIEALNEWWQETQETDDEGRTKEQCIQELTFCIMKGNYIQVNYEPLED